ncbi:MAG: ABC transporter ATP-binding protein [Burkholderiales bacterium]
MSALVLENVTCSFPARGNGGAAYTAVAGATLSVAPGEFVCLVGPTGCGKSTLLNAAAGLITAASGSVSVGGQPLKGLNRDAGYMFQSDALFPWRSALSNVAAGLDFRGVAPEEAAVRAEEWLKRVGLGGHMDKYPHELSGGMRKRVALAQVLIRDPKILLMDEPFSALDVQTRALMENELLSLWSQDRKSVLFVTHDLEEAIALADRVVVLSAGPAARFVGEFKVDLARPRDVSEIRLDPQFIKIYGEIWDCLREQVLKAYQQQRS